MENFKIENFYKDNEREVFPSYEEIPTLDKMNLMSKLLSNLQFSGKLDNKDFFYSMLERAKSIADLGVTLDGKMLESVLKENEILPAPKIFIFWSYEEELDCFRKTDFFKWFDYIWYPASDDIVLFDISLSWAILISHYGEVRVARAKQSTNCQPNPPKKGGC